jgi:hypothetical protein
LGFENQSPHPGPVIPMDSQREDKKKPLSTEKPKFIEKMMEKASVRNPKSKNKETIIITPGYQRHLDNLKSPKCD